MGQVIHIYPTRQPPPAPAVIPAEFMETPRRHATWCYWNGCKQAQRGNTMALYCLRDIALARPSDRLARAAGNTLASMGHGYALDGWGTAV